MGQSENFWVSDWVSDGFCKSFRGLWCLNSKWSGLAMSCSRLKREEKPCRDSGPLVHWPWSYPPDLQQEHQEENVSWKAGWGARCKAGRSKMIQRNGKKWIEMGGLGCLMSWYLEAHAEEDQSELPWTVVNCRELSWTVVNCRIIFESLRCQESEMLLWDGFIFSWPLQEVLLRTMMHYDALCLVVAKQI